MKAVKQQDNLLPYNLQQAVAPGCPAQLAQGHQLGLIEVAYQQAAAVVLTTHEGSPLPV